MPSCMPRCPIQPFQWNLCPAHLSTATASSSGQMAESAPSEICPDSRGLARASGTMGNGETGSSTASDGLPPEFQQWAHRFSNVVFLALRLWNDSGTKSMRLRGHPEVLSFRNSQTQGDYEAMSKFLTSDFSGPFHKVLRSQHGEAPRTDLGALWRQMKI